MRHWVLVGRVGFIGKVTTFSTYMLETLLFIRSGKFLFAGIYFLSSNFSISCLLQLWFMFSIFYDGKIIQCLYDYGYTNFIFI